MAINLLDLPSSRLSMAVIESSSDTCQRRFSSSNVYKKNERDLWRYGSEVVLPNCNFLLGKSVFAIFPSGTRATENLVEFFKIRLMIPTAEARPELISPSQCIASPLWRDSSPASALNILPEPVKLKMWASWADATHEPFSDQLDISMHLV